jgi:PrtD family type I secretion system ABC transporter
VRGLFNELKPMLSAILGFSFVINLLFLAPALFTLQVFDRVLTSHSRETLQVLLLGVAIALLILLALDYVRNRMQNVLGTVIDERLSPPVVNTLVSRAARGVRSAHFEGLRDVASLRNVFSSNALIALFDAPWVVVYVLVITAFHPLLGLGAALSAAAMLLLAWLNDRVSRRAIEETQNDSRRAAQYLEASLRNAEVLQALGMTRRLLSRWRRRQYKLGEAAIKASRNTVAFAAGARFLRQVIQILMLALGAWLVLDGLATPGAMIATTILLGRAIQPVEQVVGSWRTLVEGRAAYERLDKMAKDFMAGKSNDRTDLPAPQGRLTAEALSFRIAGTERYALNNVTLWLAPGESLAVVGPSAAGKSTLARLLIGVWAPNSGNVRLDGADVATWHRDELGPNIGYVPQDVELFDGTVGVNIARLGKVDSQAVVAAAVRANVHELILSLPMGYDTPVGEHGGNLSPGQRQRIALARALYGAPKLVVLDEPNANLDGEGEIALAQSMASLKQAGVTTVVITHRSSLLANVDKMLVLEGGRMRHYGPTAEVMKAIQKQAPQAVGRGSA